MSKCLLCQTPNAPQAVVQMDRPLYLALCNACAERWRTKYGYTVTRPDRAGASRPVPPLGSERSRTAATNAVRVSRAA